MIGKIGWQLITNPDALVCRVLKAKYFPQGDFLNVVVGHSPSFTWRSICSSQVLLRSGLRWRIGSERDVRVFQDPWVRRDGAFYIRSQYDSSLRDMRVSELLQDGMGSWDEGLLDLLFGEEESNEILRTPLNTIVADDCLIWHYSKKGCYTVKSCYELARRMFLDEELGVEGIWKDVWKLSVPPRIKFFLWRAAHDVLPTKAKLTDKKVVLSEECGFCGRDLEDIWHILVACDFAKEVWQQSRYEGLIQTMTGRWQLWKDMNDKVWNQRHPVASISVRRAELARMEWLAIQNKRRGGMNDSRSRVCNGWHDLLYGWSRCGVDTAFFANHNRTGFGIIWQDSQGEFQEAKTINVAGCMRVAEGEAMGVYEALSWIKGKGGEYVELVTDSKLVVDAIEANNEDNYEFGVIISNCRRLRDECNRVYVKHVRREANIVAHCLARRSLDGFNAYVWDEPPVFMEGLLKVPCVCDE